MTASSEHIVHEIEPVFDRHSRVLILGTMPSPKSREEGFFYGHPRNRFWTVLASLFHEPVPATNQRKRDLLLRHGIALWDVLASCDIEGASDASIKNAQPNDLTRITSTAPIEAVFCTGAKSAELYRRYCESQTGVSAVQLPSTSPANAAMDTETLTAAYQVILDHLEAPRHVALHVPEVVALEQAIAADGTSLAELMDRAGGFLAFYTHTLHPEGRIAVLCGTGNNGGDGWVAAGWLAEAGHDVVLITPRSADELRAEPAKSAAQKLMQTLPESCRILIAPEADAVAAELKAADVIIDAILGTGFSGDSVKEPFAQWIEEACACRESGTAVIAADCPSGYSAETGKAASPCIKADETVTMITSKVGLERPWAFTYCGNVTVAPIAYTRPYLDETQPDEPEEQPDDAPAPGKPDEQFRRPENEDDDGYDPYSDRPATPEPLFQQDPWN